MIYDILLYLHIGSVIASLGPFLVMFPIMATMRTAEQGQLESLIGYFKFTVRMTKHAGHVLVVSGAGLVWWQGWSWSTSWIVLTLVILFSALFFIARAFSPTLRQIAGTTGGRDALVAKLRKAVWLYLLLMMLMMWFMVAKPNIW